MEDLQKACAKIFGLVDKEGHGKISRDQLCESLRLLGLNPTDTELQMWLKPLQCTEFTYDQYLEFVTSKLPAEVFKEGRHDIREALATFDIDDTGCLDKQLLYEVLTQYGSMKFDVEDAQTLIEDLDFRHDGKIRISELEAVLVRDDEVNAALSDQKWDHV